ncbi:MAG TPA: N-acetylglucosamine kinase [Chitinophagaceae bacterium]|jgi:N-acetylglucosamine kinase-like BadF-type ATPase|nr:N-acetylglucosamine kinase [Chitinophagaceae bacterium]
MVQLIADSGSTKCEWCLINNGKKKTILTQGISPYFLDTNQIIELLQKELLPKLKNVEIANIYFYGTGLSNVNNVKIVNTALKKLFKGAKIEINHDLLAAARALCGNKKGIACILGTGSNSCFFNGKKIVKNSPGLGYVLGDEGSGAYLGKKVLQYYLYQTFDEDLLSRFEKQFNTNKTEILDAVYKKPLANRYLATFNNFLVDNRGHYMVENIIEDALNDFFFTHLPKYTESWTLPINFVGSVAHGYKDVLKELCNVYELELGIILKKPMEGLINFHK